MARENTSGSVVFMSFAQGKFVEKFSEPVYQGGKLISKEYTYEDDSGNKITKHKVEYNKLSGMLKGIELRDTKFGDQLSLTIDDGEERVILSIASCKQDGTPQQGFSSIVEFLPAIDPTQEIALRAWSSKNGEYTNSGISVGQNGNKLNKHFSIYDAETNKTTRKNGIEKFDYSKLKGDKNKKARLKLGREHYEFLEEFTQEQIKRIKTEMPVSGGGESSSTNEDW